MIKNLRSIVMLLFSVIIACGVENQVQMNSGRINSFNSLETHFKNPPAAYQTAPFWVWNDKMNKQQIDEQLADFKAKGIGGVFIHPRYGLITEYLSDEWFELVAYAVEKTRALGMHAWLYDENSFPSGFAGGHVAAEMPESYNQGQGLVLHKLDQLPPDAAEKYFLILEKDGSQFNEIADPATRQNQSSQFYLFEKLSYNKSKWYAGFSYVDLLAEGVTEKFIEVTMPGYERTIGHEFGKTVPGIFTDEPNIRPPGRESIRWTPALFERFQTRWGYDLKTVLPALVEEVGDWRRVRHNHYALLLELFIDRWSKPWFEYCEKKQLKWTGHYWEHGWPNPEHGGDNMAMYAWHQMPGIDMLFNNMDERPDQFGNIRAVKELSSVANQLGRPRTLSETYGAAGWELRFEDMKRLGDWEYVLGVNFMNQHLSFVTLKGDRKHDFPQSFSYHTPWWEFYKPLADYFSRLSLALASGTQINKTLILEPTTTTWMYYSPEESHAKLEQIKNSFHGLLEQLEKFQIEYDLGCENIIKDHGRVESAQFVVGERRYDLVVLPPDFENLDSPTFRLLKEYLQAGGKILAFTEAPIYIDGIQSNQFQELVTQHPNQWIRAESPTARETLDLLLAEDFRVAQPEKITGQLFHQRRQFEDGQLLFLVNSSLKAAAEGQIFIAGKSVIELDALNGVLSPCAWQAETGGLRINFNLPPAGSQLLFIANDDRFSPAESAATIEATVIASQNELTIKRRQPNVLTLDYCDLKLGDTLESGIYFYTASDKIFKHHGFDDNPWVSSSQYKTELVDKNKFADDSGFEATFHFTIEAGVNLSSLRAVVERPELWQVFLNGQIIQPIPGQWWLDQAFAVYDISEGVQIGQNAITLLTKPMSIYAELEPIYILGEFQLVSQSHGWKIVPAASFDCGNWRDQGLPFYGHGVAYQKTFQIQPDASKYFVKIGKWFGTVVVVRVNDQEAGIIGWPPYRLDISEQVIAGENQIEVVVYGSLKNVLGPHHNVNRRGIVTPWSFKYAPEKQPAGKDYDLDAYGLFEDFQVITKK